MDPWRKSGRVEKGKRSKVGRAGGVKAGFGVRKFHDPWMVCRLCTATRRSVARMQRGGGVLKIARDISDGLSALGLPYGRARGCLVG